MSLSSGFLFASRYEIVKEIGTGGSSVVYEAYDQINKVNVALKVFKKSVEKEDECKEFNNESMIASSLNHPNIVQVLNNGVFESKPFIVSELIKGKSLKTTLDKRHYLTIDESLDIMIQLLNALSYAHAHKCIHKDVKPHNMYVDSDGTMKLGDFGISEIMFSNEISDQKIVGSVQYCAPELFQGIKASISSDIYACGITFYEMLTGYVPFDECTPKETALAHIKNKFPSLKNTIKDCPKDLEKILLKSVEKNPKKRYKNCDEFLCKICDFKNKFQKVEK